MNHPGGHWRIGLATSTLLLVCSLRAAEPAVSFNKSIQPILSEYCYQCHGPDSASRKPKKNPLRLDQPKFAFDLRDDGKAVIIKGDAAASRVIQRIKSADADEAMPPASTHKKLKAQEIALLEQWIGQGAVYESHWSFIPPAKIEPPQDNTKWARSAVDRFVAARLKESGLIPNDDEDRARLFRRASLDLTGLPPSPKDLSRFLKDRSNTAYEKAVDRLLATDASAEHFTRYWLDAVRYADTQGIHHDHMRTLWPYRDWVISAFRTNMPFDQFTIKQLAGDLLPSATLDDKIASGYNRLLPTTGEGGAIEDEYRAIYAKDRVDTTSAVWLGLTTGCATCHDHKFDAITQKDFYAFTAFFRNSSVKTLDDGGNANTPPLEFVPARADRPRWPQLQDAIAKKSEDIKVRAAAAGRDFQSWLARLPERSIRPPSLSSRDFHLALTETNGSAHGLSDGKPVEWKAADKRMAGLLGPAPTASAGMVEGVGPSFGRNDQVSYGAYVYVEKKATGALFSKMDKANGYRGWDLFITDGKPTVHIVDQFPDAALKVTARAPLATGQWHHVMAVFDGKAKGIGALRLYVDGVPAAVDVNNDSLGTNITSAAPFRIASRTDGKGVAETIERGPVFLQDIRLYHRALKPEEVAQLAMTGFALDYTKSGKDQKAEEQSKRLKELFLAGYDPDSRKLRQEFSRLQDEETGVRKRGATTLVMDEKKDSQPVAFVLARGSYQNRGAEVHAMTPASLPPMPQNFPGNRLGLARWLVSTNNPLTARVTMNRLWAQLFGGGIVETTEDFGVMGARPVNQPLLDWLAVEFMESGWDYRHMVRLMVTSSAYRQSSHVTAEKLEKDPSNKLMSRGSRYRLDAEEIRDLALAGSGLLVNQVGGPPTHPYQPEGVWEAVAMKVSNTRDYVQDKGEGLYRRSVYTFLKRIAPPPSMEILNAPSREVFCTRRERSNTPLQALVTMNDPQFVEAARQLAALSIHTSRDFDKRLDAISLALISRRFERDERNILRATLGKAEAQFRANSESTANLLKTGDSVADKSIAAAELAAWTVIASQVMNLDECLTK